jgi:hypothetical protein
MSRATAIVIVLIGCVVVASAEANRPPKPAEAQEIFAVLEAEGLTCAAQYPPGTCRETIRVSTRNKRWAVVHIRPEENGETIVRAIDVSLHRDEAGWRIHQVGNGGGCRVPRKPRRDLHLICLPS